MKKHQILTIMAELSMSLGIHKSIVCSDGSSIISHMPISYHPYVLSERTFKRLCTLHQIWQKLIINVASDYQMLSTIAQRISKNDNFMKKICQLYSFIYKKNPNFIGVACTRIDYMGDEQPKLVEFNLTSVGLNGNSDKVQQLGSMIRTIDDDKTYYPQSKNQINICRQLIMAMEKNENIDGIVVMVVHRPEFNFGDQNFFKLQMLRRGKMVVSLTMEELIQQMVYNEKNKTCYYNSNKISAFYFRTGYSPQHFPTEKHWDLKYKMEISNAIKLPSVDMLIVNSKRMQAELAKKEVLQKYLSPQQVLEIMDVSGEIYDFDSMDSSTIDELTEKVRKQNYVLKPNREGGGNNYFGKKAYQKLIQIQKNPEELQNYIIMKGIESQKNKNIFIFDFKEEQIPQANAQFSTFGCFVYEGNKIIENKYGGFLVRLKKAEEDEGGIAINKAAIASLCIRMQKE